MHRVIKAMLLKVCNIKLTRLVLLVTLLSAGYFAYYLLLYSHEQATNTSQTEDFSQKPEKRIRNVNKSVNSRDELKPTNRLQSRRLKLIKNVCASYNKNPDHREKYITKPGSKIRGKFTFEPKSKLVLCNTMKQGGACTHFNNWTKQAHLLLLPHESCKLLVKMCEDS